MSMVGEQTCDNCTDPCAHQCRCLTVAAPEYAVPMEAGVYASTLTHPDADGGGGGVSHYASTLTYPSSGGVGGGGGSHGASDYASTLTTAPGDVDQRRGVAGLASGGQSSSA